MTQFYTITAKDVGKQTIRAFGRTWLTSNHFGPPQSRDVGKRVYQRGTQPGGYPHLQIENDEQLRERLDSH